MSDPSQFLPLTDLELDILLALGKGSLHGYGIIKDIEARSGSATDLRSGTLYLALRRLKADSLVEPHPTPIEETDGDARRKYVALTPLGRAVVSLELQRLRALVTLGAERHLLDTGTA